MATATTTLCPICKRATCQCMLLDRENLARKIGKLLRGGHGDPGPDNGFNTKNNKSRATLPRRNSDEYYTPDYALRPLLPYLPKDKVTWECAWGTGELAKHLRAAGYQVVGRPAMDFYTEQPAHWELVVSNPPYSYADEFLERAYSLGKPFAFLLPVYALGGGARVRLYQQHGIDVLVPTSRVNYFNNGKLPNGASFHSAWFCWKILPQPLMFVEADW